MRCISPMVVAIVLFFPTQTFAERTLSDEEMEKVAFLYGFTESQCDLIDMYFKTDMTTIEVYECITWKNNELVFQASGRFTYINGKPAVPQPIPQPGHALALVSKVT